MSYQSLFSGKLKKNVINLLYAELTQRVVKVKITGKTKFNQEWSLESYKQQRLRAVS